jgi:C-terminal processing protease CtpA/Prc
MQFRHSLVLATLLGFALVACKKEPDVTPTPATPPSGTKLDVRDSVYAYVQLAYLWTNLLPSAADFKPQSYVTPEALFEGVKKYSPLDAAGKNVDKWSYITTISAYNQQQSGGQTGSTGLYLAFNTTTDLRVRFVLPNSPAAQQGLTRGWKVLKVNGVAGTSDNVAAINTELGKATLELEVQDAAGATVTKTVARGTYNTKMVFDRRVLDVDGKKVGYLNLFQFVESANAELTEAFNLFESNNISDLVIDLRYNGGGNLAVAEHFANLLAPTAANGKVFYNQAFNDKLKATNDRSYTVKKTNGLNLSRVFFITSTNTASASELMINSMKVYVPVFLVGEKTYGKPVGQQARQVGNYYPFATAFKYTNANKEGDFFDGIPVQKTQIDDLTRSFGDPNEARLAEALSYIRSGAFRPARTSARISAAAEAATEALGQESLVLEGGATVIER